MRKLVLLALAAGAIAVPAATAYADTCTTTPGVGGNTVSVCNRRVWEKRQWYVTCTIDKNLDGTPESRCKEIVLIEFYG